MGEKGPGKLEREGIRRIKQSERDEFDMSHLGGYRLVYPVMGNQVLFEWLTVYRIKQRNLRDTWTMQNHSGVSLQAVRQFNNRALKNNLTENSPHKPLVRRSSSNGHHNREAMQSKALCPSTCQEMR